MNVETNISTIITFTTHYYNYYYCHYSYHYHSYNYHYYYYNHYYHFPVDLQHIVKSLRAFRRARVEAEHGLR